MNQQLRVMQGINFSFYATQAILLPLLPVYFQSKGFSSFEIGLMMSFGPFVAIFAQPMWGYLSDRLQTVKTIIWILWSFMLLCSVGLFTAEQFAWSFLFIMLLYFFQVPSTPLIDAMTVRVAQESGRSYGTVRLWGSIGFTVVALSAHWLLMLIGGIENLGFAYWGLWILPLLFLIGLRDAPAGGERVSLHSLLALLRNKRLLWFLFLVLIMMTPHRMNDSLFGLHLSDLGAAAGWIAVAWALAAASEIPVFALLGKYLNRFHELALLGIVSALYTIRWILYAVVQDPIVLGLMQASHMITFAVFWIVAVQYIVRLVPSELQTTGQSMLASVFVGMCGILGGAVGGAIKHGFGGTGMYGFGAVLAFIATILWFGTKLYDDRRRAV